MRRRFPPGTRAETAIWIDVDGLIWFNASEGHAAGDAALAAIGRLLLAECSASGLEGYRVAGDEFVLVRPVSSPELSLAEASATADRTVSKASTLDLRFTGPKRAANDRELLTVSALVFRADARLALEREAVCEELAHAIFAAGQEGQRSTDDEGSACELTAGGVMGARTPSRTQLVPRLARIVERRRAWRSPLVECALHASGESHIQVVG